MMWAGVKYVYLTDSLNAIMIALDFMSLADILTNSVGVNRKISHEFSRCK